MKPYLLIAVLVVCAPASWTQTVTFGVKGGVPAQTPLSGTDGSMPFSVGPTIEFRLPSRFSIETGFLFHRMGRVSGNSIFFYPENSLTLTYLSLRGHAWEVPVLAKYRFRREGTTWAPFVAAGPTLRRTSLETNYATGILSGTSLTSISAQPAYNGTTVKWNVDPAVAAGIDFRAGRCHLAPEVRYSYWGAGTTTVARKNQVEFLFGFRF